MSLPLLLAALLQTAPPVPAADPDASDPYRADLGYQADLTRVLGMLEAADLRDAAQLALSDLVRKYPASPRLRYEQGRRLAEAQRWEQAVAAWEEVLFVDEGRSVASVRALEGIARAEAARGRKDAELRALERLAAVSPLSYRALDGLAQAYRLRGQGARERDALRRAARLLPERGDEAAAPAGGRGIDTPALLKRVAPSVVLVRQGAATSTGFVALEPGCVVTCAHGLAEEGGDVAVVWPGAGVPGKPLPARILRVDRTRDLAVLHCPALPVAAIPLGWGRAERLSPGDRVYTIGHPGLGGSTLDLTPSEGILADARRKIDDRIFVQSNLAVNPGNSGGPLFDAAGRVIGIVVQKALEGVCLSVPSREVSEMLADPGPLAPPLPK